MQRSINDKAPAVSLQSVVIQAPFERVFSTLKNIESWPRWHSNIQTAKVVQGQQSALLSTGTKFEWKSNGFGIRSRVHTVHEQIGSSHQAFLGWTGKSFGAYAIHNWTLTDLNNGSVRVDVEESMSGCIVWLFKGTFRDNLASGMKEWVDLLKKECERPL